MPANTASMYSIMQTSSITMLPIINATIRDNVMNTATPHTMFSYIILPLLLLICIFNSLNQFFLRYGVWNPYELVPPRTRLTVAVDGICQVSAIPIASVMEANRFAPIHVYRHIKVHTPTLALWPECRIIWKYPSQDVNLLGTVSKYCEVLKLHPIYHQRLATRDDLTHQSPKLTHI